MIARCLLLIISVAMLSSCTHSKMAFQAAPVEPELASIHIIDRNGFSETVSNGERLNQYRNVDFLKNQPYQKVLRIYTRDPIGNIKAYITSYHANGQPKQYLEVSNNRANGYYREWHPSGMQKLEAYVIGGIADLDDISAKSWLFDGCSRAWDEQGRLLADIYYCSGELEGPATYYHVNGKVWKTMPAHQGKSEGVAAIYLENGELLQSTEYQAGLRHGLSKRFWQPGHHLASEETYNGGLLSSGRYYTKHGEYISDIEDGSGYRAVFNKEDISELQEYQNGVQEGEVKMFDNRGVLVSTHHIKNGVKNGEEIEYFPPSHVDDDLTPRFSINWLEGKIQGIAKSWYANGILESQREMSNNEKNGIFSSWYESGNIMLLEEYEHNKLVKGEYYSPGEKLPVSYVNNGRGLATIYDSRGNLIRKINYNNGKPLVE